jgi:hypothetical protein
MPQNGKSSRETLRELAMEVGRIGAGEAVELSVQSLNALVDLVL